MDKTLPFGVGRHCQPLAAYILEIEHRLASLQLAYHCDEFFGEREVITRRIGGEGKRGYPKRGCRQTRQDINQGLYRWEIEEEQARAANERREEEYPDYIDDLRRRSRLACLLKIYESKQYSLDRLHAFAIEQAQTSGMPNVVPLLVSCTNTYKDVLWRYSQLGWHRGNQNDWGDVCEAQSQQRADLDELRTYMPASVIEQVVEPAVAPEPDPPASTEEQEAATQNRKRTGRKRPKCDTVLYETLKSKPESIGWPIDRWVLEIGYGKTTIWGTEIWKTIIGPHHKLALADRSTDRHRRPSNVNKRD